ncbi:MAG: hypothetical protein KYX62_18570 [Pseudomonadota bacterium]|nr:hypothetical protein [Pseudomonadota bacterium]
MENEFLDSEVQVRLQNHLLSQIWHNSPDNMFIMRPAADDFYFVGANIAQRTSLELVSTVPRDMALRQLLPPDIYENVTSNYRRCMELKDSIHYEEAENLTTITARCSTGAPSFPRFWMNRVKSNICSVFRAISHA